jgi:hypothetical protein
MFLALVFKHYRDKQTSAFEQLASHRMKRFILLLAIVSTSTFSVLAQGTINYATRVSGVLITHVYGTSYTGPPGARSGNTAGETPTGTQVYSTAVLQGSGFSAQLFAANGSGQTEGSLTLVPLSTTTFRTGATLGGTIATSVLTIPQVTPAGVGTFQLRVWDNVGGTITSWAMAEPLWNNGLGVGIYGLDAGKSALFEFAVSAGGADQPADMLTFRSFNLTSYDTPEPGTWALFGLGGLIFALFSRRKTAALKIRRRGSGKRKLEIGNNQTLEPVMKKLLLLLAVLSFSLSNVLAQGTIIYSIRSVGFVEAHVYGPDLDFSFKTGNTASELPSGTQTYTGALLTGSGFSAQLFAANGSGQPESALTAVPNSITTFRTGGLAGTIAPSVLTIPQVPFSGTGTFQLRAWDNQGGAITSWTQADVWFSGSPALGKSALFEITVSASALDIPVDMVNFRSFNLHYNIPEPGAFALLGTGGLVLAIFRRNKLTR